MNNCDMNIMRLWRYRYRDDTLSRARYNPPEPQDAHALCKASRYCVEYLGKGLYRRKVL